MPDTDLRETVARHDEQLRDHDRVIRALEEHLREIAHEFASFQTWVKVATGVFLVSSPQGEHVLKVLGIG